MTTQGNSTGVLGLPWFSKPGFQQMRGFQALMVRMPLKFHDPLVTDGPRHSGLPMPGIVDEPVHRGRDGRLVGWAAERAPAPV